MADKYPEFVQFGELTPAGKELIAYIEAKIAETVQLYEAKGDINFLNGMSGTLKHYYTWVGQMKSTTPEKFLTDFAYGAVSMYENMLMERQAAETEQKASWRKCRKTWPPLSLKTRRCVKPPK